MFNPCILQQSLEESLKKVDVKHVMIFQNIEGSILAKASSSTEDDKSLNSYAAVLANICHEYIEFGLEAFDNNKFKSICIEHQGNLLLAMPIWKTVKKDENQPQVDSQSMTQQE